LSPTGHLAIGFAAKKWETKVPLIWLLIGAYLIDLVYLCFQALGIEEFGNNPWSHSLLMAFVYSSLAGILTWFFTKHQRSAILMGLVVMSHWILDFIVWNNLSLAFEPNPSMGLGLYQWIGFDINALTLNMSMFISTGLELGMLVLGIVIYIGSRKNKSTIKVA